jgi:Transposase DDE domain
MDGKPSASRSDGLRAAMNSEPASDDGKACSAKRQQTIEPVFSQIKSCRARRFLRRGLAACNAEWSCCVGPVPAQVVAAPARPPAAS